MSPEMNGFLAVGTFGLFNMGVLGAIGARMEAQAATQEQEWTPGIFRMVAFLDVIVLAVLGHFLVPMFME